MDFYPPVDWTRHALHAAAISGNRTEVERLIARGANVNELLELDVDGRQDVAGTPLHVTLRNICWDDPDLYPNHHAIVKILLAKGANVHLCRKWEGTPLHDAAGMGLTHIADVLISHGADVNSKEDAQGRTPLHFAAANGKSKMVQYLLSKGAVVDEVAHVNLDPYAPRRIPKDMGKTPLHLAAREGHGAVVKLLMDAGASLHLRTAVDLALQSKQESDRKFDQIIGLLTSAVSL